MAPHTTERGLKRLLMVVALVSIGVAHASAQSLGEVARKEGERRKTVKPAGKVYTNDSLRPQPQPSSTPASTGSVQAETPAAGGAQASQPAPSGEDTSEARAKDEASWKSRMAEARKALERAQAFQAALESQINGLTTEFINRDDPAQRSVVAGKRDKAMAELESVRKDVDQQTKAIAQIQEEARRAGVPAGWVR